MPTRKLQDLKVILDYRKGMSLRLLAKKYGVTHQAIAACLRRNEEPARSLKILYR